MRSFLFAFTLTCIAADSASANLVITIDKSHQRMLVSVNGEDRYSWPISSARAGYVTPNGTYHPEHLAKRWFSHKYYGSPMPHAIFYHGGFAIHGSYETSRLGRAASHGCVRLHPEHAAALFALVQEEGLSSTDIVITGSDPPAPRYAQPRWPLYSYRGGFFGRL